MSNDSSGNKKDSNKDANSTNRMTCQLDSLIKDKASNSQNAVSQGLSSIKDKIKDTKNTVTNKIQGVVVGLQDKKTELLASVKSTYNKTPIGEWSLRRPDITLLIEISILVGLSITLYSMWPYLTGSSLNIFTKEQYMKAMYLPETEFSIQELGQIKLEKQAFLDYFDYFNSPPYSPENQGINDIAKGNLFLPIISFLAIYIVPPFVVLYIIWFIVTYWTYVFNALYGWLQMVWSYGSSLIECNMAKKWYIRAITGWSRDCPDFGEYFNNWRREYIDIPVYEEKLKYILQYYAAKRKYYEIPKMYYIDLPRERYAIKAEYLRKVYVDRAYETFLHKLLNVNKRYVDRPRDELYRYVLGENKNLAALWAKVQISKKQINGQPYESTTKSGKKCSCPATQTPVTMVTNLVTDNIQAVKGDLSSAAQKMRDVYDKIHQTQANLPKACEVANHAIDKRFGAFWSMVGLILVVISGIYIFSSIYGTPAWVQLLTAPTWRYVTGLNLQPQLQSITKDYSLYLVIGVVFGIMGFGVYQM
jgi:hypothetical protein